MNFLEVCKLMKKFKNKRFTRKQWPGIKKGFRLSKDGVPLFSDDDFYFPLTISDFLATDWEEIIQ